MKLFTGGTGLLGTKLKELYPLDHFPTRSELDFTDDNAVSKYIKRIGCSIDAIIHLGAYTNTIDCENDINGGIEAIDVNIKGTANIATYCMEHNIRLIYISTDYVFDGNTPDSKEEDPVKPFNKYAWTKLGGECSVMLCPQYVIIRGTFGPDQFTHKMALVDQYVSRLPVTEYAKRVAKVIEGFKHGIIHIGGDRRSVYDYALEFAVTDVIPTEKKKLELEWYKFPHDTSLNVDKYADHFGEWNNA